MKDSSKEILSCGYFREKCFPCKECKESIKINNSPFPHALTSIGAQHSPNLPVLRTSHVPGTGLSTCVLYLLQSLTAPGGKYNELHFIVKKTEVSRR